LGWQKLHDAKLHDLYSTANIIRVTNSWTGLAMHGEMRSEYKVLVGKFQGKRLLGSILNTADGMY
jgi:hypothetical protein